MKKKKGSKEKRELKEKMSAEKLLPTEKEKCDNKLSVCGKKDGECQCTHTSERTDTAGNADADIIKEDSHSSQSPYSEIHERAEGIPEDLAEDIVEAIEEAHERSELREKKSKRHPSTLTLRELIIVVAFGIILFWALNHAKGIFGFFGSVADVFSPLITGFCIAFILNLVLIPLETVWKKATGGIKHPSVKKYVSKIKRPICLVLSTLIMAGLVFGLFFIVIPELGVTFGMFADMAPEFIEKCEGWIGGLSEFLKERNLVLPSLTFDADKAIDMLRNFFTQRGQQMLNTTVGFTTSVFSVVFDTVLAFVFAFYILAQKERLSAKMHSILYAVTDREKADNIIKVAALSNSAFTKFVTGQFTEAAIIGVLCWLGMTVLGMPYATVISVVIGATALIPIFGAFAGAAIGAILIVGVDFMQAVWFIVFIIVLQQIETNLIYPRVVGKSIGLPGILVLASVTVGGAVFGFGGIVLGIPVCSVIYCIFNEFVDKRTEDMEEKTAKKISGKHKS